MEYLIFSFQVVIAGYLLIQKITKSLNFGFLLYYFIIIFAIIMFYFMYKMEVSKLFIVILSFILGTFLTKTSNLFNLLSFGVLYFYIIDKTKENEIFSKKLYFLLAWIVLLGLIPKNPPTIFLKHVSTLIKEVISFLFFNEVSSNNYQNTTSSKIFNSIQNIINEKAPADVRFLGFANTLALFVSFAILIILIFLFILILKTEVAHKNYKNKKYQRVISLALLLSITSFLMIFISFKYINDNTSVQLTTNVWKGLFLLVMYFSIIVTIYRISRQYILRQDQREFYIAPRSLMILLSVCFVLLIAGLTVIILSGERSAISFISLSIIAFLILIYFYVFSLRREIAIFENNEIFKEPKKLVENYTKFGEDYLNIINDPREFVIYLYFLSLINFSKVGFKLSEGMTPKEFLKKVKPFLKSNSFASLTDAFYIVEYSSEQINHELFEMIKNNSKDLLNEILLIGEPKGLLETEH
ncbi:hypothetical protein [Caldisericum exile]|uniref:Hypothetical membrane protein n=1 Tax=Caldisericum exile (strain DSM 21853 / NBRC 104410 / AZM16c01) TaxID=511051 RepID=A0A7U6GEI4_CALEA|nr:hypothetical protein [Caldisericum exile]BAL80905.1 hypothetical membrane protein [Caldisericum exile AZM16c01]